jgi:hypothetical protein
MDGIAGIIDATTVRGLLHTPVTPDHRFNQSAR